MGPQNAYAGYKPDTFVDSYQSPDSKLSASFKYVVQASKGKKDPEPELHE